MSSCSRNDLCASSPLKSKRSLHLLNTFLCVKSRQSTKYKSAAISFMCTRICTNTRVQASIVRRLHQRPEVANHPDADCHLSPPSARLFLTINLQKKCAQLLNQGNISRMSTKPRRQTSVGPEKKLFALHSRLSNAVSRSCK